MAALAVKRKSDTLEEILRELIFAQEPETAGREDGHVPHSAEARD